MKKIIIISINILILLYNAFPVFNKDAFSVVLIDENNSADIYKDHDNNSEVIEKLPAGYKDIKTTWKTFNNKKDYWIEIEYNNQKGWLNRKYLTRNFGELNENGKIKIENLLLNLTKSLQQKNFSIFKNIFYFIRGIIIYDKKISNFEYNNLNSLWNDISDINKNQNIKFFKLFENILELLEHEFEIEYPAYDEKSRYNIPIEINNFQYIILKYKEKDLYIGIEFWNDKPYICFLSLF